MRKYSFISCFACFALISFLFLSCSDSVDEEGGGEKLPAGQVAGVAQKGPLLKGSSVTIYSLDKSLNPTGLTFPTETIDDFGSYSVVGVNAPYVDVKASGYYLNEIWGYGSSESVNLQALAPTGYKINANVFTTLAYNRIKHLVRDGLSFDKARKQAQEEVVKALGFGTSTTLNFTEMDVTKSGDDNAMLLAASVMIVYNRSGRKPNQLLRIFADDLEDDGELDEFNTMLFHLSEQLIPINEVYKSYLKFYNSHEMEDFDIPPFYKFLDMDKNGKPDGEGAEYFYFLEGDGFQSYFPESVNPNMGYPAEGFTYTLTFLYTVPFEVKCDADWLTVDLQTLTENVYKITVSAPANTGANRVAKVDFVGKSGNVLRTVYYQQKAAEGSIPQRITLVGNDGKNPYLTEIIGVNGKDYAVQHLASDPNTLYVEIPYEARQQYYQVYFPTNMVSVPEGKGKYKVMIPKEMTSDTFPFIGQVEPSDQMPEFTNPFLVPFFVATPSITVYNDCGCDHIVVVSERPICGAATNTVSSKNVRYSEMQIVQEESLPDADGKYRITMKVLEPDVKQNIQIPVLQYNTMLNYEMYDAENQLIRKSITLADYYRVTPWGTLNR